MNLFSPGKRTGGKIDSYQTEHSCRKGGGMGQGKEKSAWCTTGKTEVKRSRMELCGYRGSQSRLLRLSLRRRDQAHPASSQGVLGAAPVWGRGHPLSPGSCTAPSHFCSQKQLLNSLHFLQLHLSFICVPFIWTQTEVSWRGFVALLWTDLFHHYGSATQLFSWRLVVVNYLSTSLGWMDSRWKTGPAK